MSRAPLPFSALRDRLTQNLGEGRKLFFSPAGLNRPKTSTAPDSPLSSPFGIDQPHLRCLPYLADQAHTHFTQVGGFAMGTAMIKNLYSQERLVGRAALDAVEIAAVPGNERRIWSTSPPLFTNTFISCRSSITEMWKRFSNSRNNCSLCQPDL